jgi:N-methylhydantoinase A
MRYKLGVDVGGTFTDIFLMSEDTGRLAVHKVPSTPDDPSKAILTGVEEILKTEGTIPESVSYLAHGTTVATNAIIEQRGGRVGLLTTAGFRDLLEIGRQTRPRLYDLQLDHPAPLVPRHLRLEVSERLYHTGEVAKPLDVEGARAAVRKLREEHVQAVALCFLYSFVNSEHEAQVKSIVLEEMPGCKVSVSHEVLPEFREYERLSVTTLNAFLMSVMDRYLENFQRDVFRLGIKVSPKVNQCNGGIMSVDAARRFPVKTVLSGPSAGVVGALFTAEAMGCRDLITFDMGGTSTDVCLVRDGVVTVSNDRWVGGYPAKIPAVDVNAVGAGGGSVAWIDLDSLLKVGPRSAGALPGPVCYALGGKEATVTDANVVLGRLNPEFLLGGRMRIDKAAAGDALSQLGKRLGLGIVETAHGILRIVVAKMVKAIRAVSVERGHDPKAFSLLAFGGAGPLHAVSVARDLEIQKVIVPPHPGILCAMGLLVADARNDYVKTSLRNLTNADPAFLEAGFQELESQARKWLTDEGFAPIYQRLTRSLDLRYVRQNFELSVAVPAGEVTLETVRLLTHRFYGEHERNYGHFTAGEPIQVVNFRVRAEGLTRKFQPDRLVGAQLDAEAIRLGEREVWFDAQKPVLTPILYRACLRPGERLTGPLVIEQMDSTTIVPPGDTAVVDPFGNIVIDLARS